MNDNQTPLESWKEIASYLQRDVTTVRRWEKKEQLPVHRHTHERRSSVYAYPSEIDAWKASRKVIPELAPARPLWKFPAFAVTLLLCLVMVGNGIRPVAAQQQTGPSTRQLWLTRPSQYPGGITPGVSPDGLYIAFTDFATGDLFVRDFKTGTNRPVATGRGPDSGDYGQGAAFSPDNRFVAYLWFDGKESKSELRVVPRAGGTPRTLLRGDFNNSLEPLEWTPDGKQLLALRRLPDQTSQITLVSVDTGAVQTIKSIGWRYGRASLSPDGRYIAYDAPAENRNDKDIYVVAVDGSHGAAVVQNPAGEYEPVWSPDGSRILFISTRTGKMALWSVPMENGNPSGPEELVKADFLVETMAMTRNGTLFYLVPGSSSPNVYAAELGPDMKVSKPPALATEHFVNSNNGPALSPDGQFLAFESFRESGSAVVVRNLKSGDQRDVHTQITVSMIRGIGPMWFPDGRSLLVLSREAQKPGAGLYRVNIESGRADLILRVVQPMAGYQLSPDGKALFYTEQIPGSAPPSLKTRLMRFDLDSRQETELKTGEFFISVSVSPDSKQLAYLATITPGTSSYIAVMPTVGGESREVYRGSPWTDNSRFRLAWTPDQRWLLFVRGGAADNSPSVLLRAPVTGGQPEQLFASEGIIGSPQVEPDGRRLFFSGMETTGNQIWALENFLPKPRSK